MPWDVWKLSKATVAVVVFPLVRMSANRNSFQAPTKTNTAVAKIPPRASGATTWVRTCHSVAPSIRAASTRFAGRSRRNPRTIQIANGKSNATVTTIMIW